MQGFSHLKKMMYLEASLCLMLIQRRVPMPTNAAIDIERSDAQIDPVAAPMSNDEHILKQVMGDEKINIHINFDILLIKGEKSTEKKNEASPSNGARIIATINFTPLIYSQHVLAIRQL